jgi:hypothetical protein
MNYEHDSPCHWPRIGTDIYQDNDHMSSSPADGLRLQLFFFLLSSVFFPLFSYNKNYDKSYVKLVAVGTGAQRHSWCHGTVGQANTCTSRSVYMLCSHRWSNGWSATHPPTYQPHHMHIDICTVQHAYPILYIPRRTHTATSVLAWHVSTWSIWPGGMHTSWQQKHQQQVYHQLIDLANNRWYYYYLTITTNSGLDLISLKVGLYVCTVALAILQQ